VEGESQEVEQEEEEPLLVADFQQFQRLTETVAELGEHVLRLQQQVPSTRCRLVAHRLLCVGTSLHCCAAPAYCGSSSSSQTFAVLMFLSAAS
jgi:hypothetical protein